MWGVTNGLMPQPMIPKLGPKVCTCFFVAPYHDLINSNHDFPQWRILCNYWTILSGIKVRMSDRVWFKGELRVWLQGVMGEVKVTKVSGVAGEARNVWVSWIGSYHIPVHGSGPTQQWAITVLGWTTGCLGS